MTTEDDRRLILWVGRSGRHSRYDAITTVDTSHPLPSFSWDNNLTIYLVLVSMKISSFLIQLTILSILKVTEEEQYWSVYTCTPTLYCTTSMFYYYYQSNSLWLTEKSSFFQIVCLIKLSSKKQLYSNQKHVLSIQEKISKV